MFHDLDDPVPPSFDGPFRRGVRSRVRTRRRRRVAAGGAVGAIALGIGGTYAWAGAQLSGVEQIDVAGTGAVDPGEPTTVLLIGTDGAAPLDPEVPGVEPGERADSMILVRIDPQADTIKLLSIPRDLEVSPAGSPPARLNIRMSTGGIATVVSDIESLGVEVDHVMVVDFEGLTALVDTVGGINIDIGAPMRDSSSGLALDETGCVHLDGTQALALLRARHLEWLGPDGWTLDPSGDVGRTDRQRAVLLAAASQLRSQVPDPFTANQFASWAQEHLRVDSELSTRRLIELINSARQIDPTGATSARLPAEPATLDDGAAVLRPTGAAAGAIEQFEDAEGQGSTPPAGDRPAGTPSYDEIRAC